MTFQKNHSRTLQPVTPADPSRRSTPVQHPRTIRQDSVSVVTSGFGGNFLPVKCIPLLREDSCSGTINLNFQMAETADMLLNPVRVTAAAYLVPKLALSRFSDMGAIDRSYNGQQEIDGSVIPWFEEQLVFTSDFYTTLGLHSTFGNDDYLQSYNAVWNHVAGELSNSIPERAPKDTTIAPAFWRHSQLRHVKPTFDDALIEGEIELQVTDGTQMPVTSPSSATVDTDKVALTAPAATFGDDGTGRVISSEIYAEFASSGITMSLASINQAREMAAWARLRNQYAGLSDEWMMDQLLSGIRIRDEALRQPILLDSQDSVMGMTQRYATDAANLDKSLTDGAGMINLRVNVPPIITGGTIVIVAQILPEMVYERQRDYYQTALTVADLPNRTRDELDPQPVELVTNAEVDENHTLPNDLFGYAPLNHGWQRVAPNIGGKYFKRSASDAWTENRNRIWSTEVVDPTLGPDFYLSTTLSHAVFADSSSDPFEIWANGNVRISGLTYFGAGLRENNDDYDKVKAQVPSERIDGSVAPS